MKVISVKVIQLMEERELHFGDRAGRTQRWAGGSRGKGEGGKNLSLTPECLVSMAGRDAHTT